MDLYNRREASVRAAFPELAEINRSVRGKCVLDGELIVLEGGTPSFDALQRRELLSNPTRVALAAARHPASLVAFDILYKDGENLTGLPLTERKRLLREAVTDGERLAVSRAVEREGVALFALTKQQGLEGIVAKRKDSRYQLGKRSGDWIKIKNLIDEDFVLCGYIVKEAGIVSAVLGQYQGGGLCYCGHATLGVSRRAVERYPTAPQCPFAILPAGNEKAVWFAPPRPVCTVTYMLRTPGGGIRHPRFKGFRDDVDEADCKMPAEIEFAGQI